MSYILKTLDDVKKTKKTVRIGNIELKPHQVEAVNFINTHGNCIIADEMGLGKTPEAIASVVEYYEKQHKKMKTLVVVPASLKATWIYEGFIKFGISKNDIKEIVSPSKTNINNLKQWFTVVSYEGFTRLYKDLAKIKWDFVIFDEAHYLKNKTSARTKSALEFRKLLPRTDFISMTGTPITGKLSDLVPLLILSKIDRDDLKQFEELASKTDYKKTPKELAKEDRFIKYDAIHTLLKQYMLRRRKEDVLSLPEKMRRLVWLTMTQNEEQQYKNVFSDYVRTTGKNYSKSRGLVETLKWRQFASLLKAKKIKPFIEMLLEKNLKVILFCSFKDTIEILNDMFEDIAVVIDGSKSHLQKQSAQELFKRYGKDIIIANIKAGGTGFNWTEASDTIFLDLDWVPSNQWQAEDRTHRIGQVDPVYIYYFILAGTVEQEIMLNKLSEKETVISKVLNEPSEMSKIKVVTQKELVDEIKRRKTKTKKLALDFEAIKKEFIKLTDEYTETSHTMKRIKELQQEVDEYNRKTGRLATKKQKWIQQLYWDLDSIFQDDKTNRLRYYLAIKGVRPSQRPFITPFRFDSGKTFKRQFESIAKYRGFYIHYIPIDTEKSIKNAKQTIDDLINNSDNILALMGEEDNKKLQIIFEDKLGEEEYIEVEKDYYGEPDADDPADWEILYKKDIEIEKEREKTEKQIEKYQNENSVIQEINDMTWIPEEKRNEYLKQAKKLIKTTKESFVEQLENYLGATNVSFISRFYNKYPQTIISFTVKNKNYVTYINGYSDTKKVRKQRLDLKDDKNNLIKTFTTTVYNNGWLLGEMIDYIKPLSKDETEKQIEKMQSRKKKKAKTKKQKVA